MNVYVFEGKSYDPADICLTYDHSLALYENFDIAEKMLEWEKELLIIDGYEVIKTHKNIDSSGAFNVECVLRDALLNERKLTVNQWSVLK